MARTDKQGTQPTERQHSGGEGHAAAGEPATAREADAREAAAREADQEQAPAAPEKPAMSVFAAAIERKKAAGQARSAHLDGSAKVGGATSNHKTSRTFRRKSG
jgi:hypothetical protein